MPKIKKPMLECNATLTPKQAIAFRNLGLDLKYRCPGCNAPVIVVSTGEDNDGVKYRAHFEHKTRNRECVYGVGIKAPAEEIQAR